MFRQRTTTLLVAAVVSCAMPLACQPEEPRPPSSIVRQVDHILVESSEANELFSLLADTFQLPVAWPMTDYGGFASGGVAVGNVNLEVLQNSRWTEEDLESRWTGFALEPEPLGNSLPEGDARGIRHGAPAPFRSKQPDGSFTTRWTTVSLPEVSSDSVQVFLCQYGNDVTARRRLWLEQLQSRDGGPLSIHSVRELVYGAKDVTSMRKHWQKLLDPVQASSVGLWLVGDGPAIRVVPADRDGIRELVINVNSLPQARRFLQELGRLGTEEPGALTLSGSPLQGLKITIVEGP